MKRLEAVEVASRDLGVGDGDIRWTKLANHPLLHRSEIESHSEASQRRLMLSNPSFNVSEDACRRESEIGADGDGRGFVVLRRQRRLNSKFARGKRQARQSTSLDTLSSSQSDKDSIP